MPGLNSPDADSVIRVVVSPAQSSYFAGETLSVTITFTNTCSVEAGPSRTVSHSHKRGAHSISSAPLARPPTSPGTPRNAVQPSSSRTTSADDAPVRKGLIGVSHSSQGPEQLPDLIEQRRKKLLAKSLSVSISANQLGEHSAESSIVSSPSFTRRPLPDTRLTPTSPLVPTSSLKRTDALPLSSNHPHARKQSVLDGGQLSLDVVCPTTSVPPLPYSPNSSTSTFSLALDPIAETAFSPYPSTTAFSSPVIESPDTTFNKALKPNTVYAYPPPPPSQRPLHIGLGQPPRGNGVPVPRTAFSSTFPQPNTELILYAYAQIKGTVVLTPVPGAFLSQEQTQTLNSIRSALLRRTAFGGGSMDIASSLQQPMTRVGSRPSHRRSVSFSSSILSLLSPSSLVSSASLSPSNLSKWRSPLSPSSPKSAGLPNGSRLGLGLGLQPNIGEEVVDPELPLPTFEQQPTMLAVDLMLLPGESRSYTYTTVLPDNLPPTFKGKSVRFSYELVIGTSRATSARNATGTNGISKVMKVPIRVYNNVVVGRPPKSYDLLWPLNRAVNRNFEGNVVEQTGKMVKRTGLKPLSPSSETSEKGLKDLREYAQMLTLLNSKKINNDKKLSVVNSFPVRSDNNDSHAEMIERNLGGGQEAEGGLTGCREAVEILTRNPKKASYDVNKDGVKVAVLTFTKSAYRLGETVCGVVELNDRLGRARVLQMSAMLEAHESLPSSISPPNSSRHLRRSHAEHYSSFTLCTQRTTFSLDIPSDASPAFQIRIGNGAGTPGGIEWKVRLCLLVAIAAESSQTGTEGVRFKSLVRDGPRGDWSSSWRAPTSIAPKEKSQAPSSPPIQETQQSWAQYFTSSFLGPGEKEYHDGDEIEGEEEGDADSAAWYDGIKPDPGGGVGVGVDFGGGEEGWRDVKLEMVECEVPIKVWPGNTAYKAMDVVFGV